MTKKIKSTLRKGQFKLVTVISHRFQGKHGLFTKEKEKPKISNYSPPDFH